LVVADRLWNLLGFLACNVGGIGEVSGTHVLAFRLIGYLGDAVVGAVDAPVDCPRRVPERESGQVGPGNGAGGPLRIAEHVQPLAEHVERPGKLHFENVSSGHAILRSTSYNLTWLAEVEALRTRDVVSGAAAGVIGGYVGTRVMNPVTTKLQEFAPEADKQREKAVSPGSPYKIGVQKAADLAGVKLDPKQVDAAASAAPYTVGIAGG